MLRKITAIICLLAAMTTAHAIDVSETDGVRFNATGSGQFPTYDNTVRIYMDTATNELYFVDATTTPAVRLAQLVYVDDDGTTVSIDLGSFDLSNTVLSTTTNTAHMIIRPYVGKNMTVELSSPGDMVVDGGNINPGTDDDGQIGETAARWARGYYYVLDAATRVDSPLNQTDSIKPYTGGGNLLIGHSDDDVLEIHHQSGVEFLANIVGNVLPVSDGIGELGTTALTWDDVRAGTATVTTALPGDLSLSANAIAATDEGGVTIFDNAGNGLTIADGGAVTASHALSAASLAATGAVTGASATITGSGSFVNLASNSSSANRDLLIRNSGSGANAGTGIGFAIGAGNPKSVIYTDSNSLSNGRHDFIIAVDIVDDANAASFTDEKIGINGSTGDIRLSGGFGSSGATVDPSGNVSTDGNLTVNGDSTLGDAPGDVLTIEGSDTRWITDRTGNYAGKYVVSDRISNAGASDVYTLAQPVAGDCSGQFTVRVNGVFDTAADNGEQYYLISNHYYSNSDAGVEAGALGAATTAGTALTVTVDSTGTSFRVTVAENVASGNVDYIVTIEYQWTVPYT